MIKRYVRPAVMIGLFLLACGFQRSTAAQSWAEFQSKDGAFSILMPYPPARQVEMSNTAAGTVAMVMYTATTDSLFCAVIYADFPSAPSNAEETNKLLDSGRDGGLERTKGKLVSETRITLDGHLGREIKAKVDEGILLVRIYSVKQRLYQIIIAGSEAEVTSASAARFFNSFKLTQK